MKSRFLSLWFLLVLTLSISAQEATFTEAVEGLWQKRFKELAVERKPEMDAKVVKADGKTMRLLEQTFGEPPEAGYPLFISMHGGGGAPPPVNERQWKNQIRLYQPKTGIVVAPRAPTDTWNLWHQGHIDSLFDRLIENYVVLRGVNPDKVYLLGYSAGGDGVYQLAPRMADRFAAASMMAGHPNNANPLGLRNLPFMIWCGERDGAYKRNQVAVQWGKRLDALAKADKGGYPHRTHIVRGVGHWMNGADRAAIVWMATHSRDPWPGKIVWHQAGRTHSRFYWLHNDKPAAGQTVTAVVKGQTIALEAEAVPELTLRLSDELVDLDQPVKVVLNGDVVHEALVPRSTAAMDASLRARFDRSSAASAFLRVGAK